MPVHIPSIIPRHTPKNKGILLTNIYQNILTCQEHEEINVQSVTFSNLGQNETLKFDLYLWMGTEQKSIFLAKNFPLPTNKSYFFNGINMLYGDQLKVRSSASGEIDAVTHYMSRNIDPILIDTNILPSTYNRYGNLLTTNEIEIVSCPINKTLVVHDGVVLNKTEDPVVSTDIILKKADTSEYKLISTNIFIPPYSAIPIDNINLEPGDSIRASCNKNNSVDILLNTNEVILNV